MLKSIIRTLLQKFIDDEDAEDAGDGTTMRRWYATMVANGTMVDWEDVI